MKWFNTKHQTHKNALLFNNSLFLEVCGKQQKLSKSTSLEWENEVEMVMLCLWVVVFLNMKIYLSSFTVLFYVYLKQLFMESTCFWLLVNCVASWLCQHIYSTCTMIVFIINSLKKKSLNFFFFMNFNKYFVDWPKTGQFYKISLHIHPNTSNYVSFHTVHTVRLQITFLNKFNNLQTLYIYIYIYIHTHTLTGHFIRYTLLVPWLDPLLPSELP